MSPNKGAWLVGQLWSVETCSLHFKACSLFRQPHKLRSFLDKAAAVAANIVHNLVKKGIWMSLDRNLEGYFSSREKQFLNDIVANGRNGIDVDKFDYIVRDTRACALGCIFQFQRFCYLHTLGFLSSNSHVVSVMFEVPSTFDIGYELAHVECGRLTHAPDDVGCGLWAMGAGCVIAVVSYGHLHLPMLLRPLNL
ncbi:hypothetical protein T459_10797 [Capsicum annuum]|uniref:Uncharacterized protein n=1 Tax=Capsicum annuum TaxID=4072 RepID=A0A2G3A3C6_CAPAN|nr:hypothetical protein T459_10797 [Capsicum annuum]